MKPQKIFITGNGNLSFENFQRYYITPLKSFISESEIILGDFKGVDVMMMEYLKDKTSNVTICHLFDDPRYFPDIYKTLVRSWDFKGGFKNHYEADEYMIRSASHFIAFDQNSTDQRKTATHQNIQRCLDLGRCWITHE
jgi:hypothetical protein